jgi:hypothetical protein
MTVELSEPSYSGCIITRRPNRGGDTVHREREKKQNSRSETDPLRSQNLHPGPPSVWNGDTKDTYPNSNFVILTYGLNHVWVVRGTGTPKDRAEVNRGEF